LARLAWLLLALIGGVQPAFADGADEDEAARALAASQAAIGRTVRDVELRDRAGDFLLSDLRGKPVVISPIYTSCAHTCPLITQTLANAVAAAQAALGGDRFVVLSVGFDVPSDTIERMAAYRRDQGITNVDWRFVTAEAPAIAGLLDDIGLTVLPVAGGFDHLAQVTLLDQEGRVVRQVYGEDFEPPILVDPLLEMVLKGGAADSFLAGVVDRVVLFCTVYDPATGAYRFDYALFVEVAIGAVSIAAVGAFVWREARRTLTARR
jgi:protein SCO1/2